MGPHCPQREGDHRPRCPLASPALSLPGGGAPGVSSLGKYTSKFTVADKWCNGSATLLQGQALVVWRKDASSHGTHTHTHRHTFTSMHMHTHAHSCTHAHTHTPMHMHTHTHTCMHTHTCCGKTQGYPSTLPSPCELQEGSSYHHPCYP